MRAEDSEGRPAGNGPTSTSLNGSSADTTATSPEHPAAAAVDSVSMLNVHEWERRIILEVSAGNTVCADELQERYGLPDVGNATGGIFMRMARARLIRRVTWKASSKPSRSGGVVSVWAAGDCL